METRNWIGKDFRRYDEGGLMEISVWDGEGNEYGNYDHTQLDFTPLLKSHWDINKDQFGFEYSAWVVPFTMKEGAFTMSDIFESESEIWAPMPSPVSGAVGFVHSHPGRKISSTAMSEKDETAEKVLRLPFFVIACDDGLLIRCLDRNGNVKIELTTT